MLRGVREHIWHTDRTAEEQRAFLTHVAASTRRFVTVAALVAIVISVLSWPLDYLSFRDRGHPELLWHITEWRLIVIGLSVALLSAFRLFPRHIIVCLSVLTL